ncbi:class I SAM-dependent methyltransferase [Nocardioides sp. MAHUQ-72]|uniref:class I SAM-dependent methyltransferase n=1 Tax=unclassified Nocardioides TaxID=2615069 RepID=UPI0036215F8E
MSLQPQEAVARTAAMFDTVAPAYDQSGVPFFGPIAAGLVDLLAPRPGERALDIGAGRGAATLRLAERVGPGGHVDALDVSPAMVELLGREVADRGLRQVSVGLGDATDPRPPLPAYDLVAASLVLFFLPDPVAALRRWSGLLAPGSRVGVATFRPWPPTWRSLEDLFAEYAAPAPGPGPTTMPEVYADDGAVEGLFRAAGLSGVRTEVVTYAVPFTDTEQWRVWSLGTAMRGLWMRVPEEAHAEVLERVTGILEDAGGSLDVAIRYTVALAPEA